MARDAIEIALLGDLSVRRSGAAVGLPASRKTRALLGYLVLSGTPQPRARLCELLWDGPVDPRAELRWSLSKLRSLVSDETAQRLCVADDSVAFLPAGAFVDVHELSGVLAGDPGLADSTRAVRAASLFRGELLAGLELPDCFRFNAWLTAERERLFALRVRLHSRLSALDERGPEEALRWARAWVALDPICEAAHAAAVRALLALGRSRDAAAQVDTCRRILRQELGVEAGEKLDAARRQRPLIATAEGSKVAPPAPESPLAGASATVHPPLPIPFVGRLAELDGLKQSLAEGMEAAGTFLLIEGEPGIGKSRLLHELQFDAAARGVPVLTARGFETEVSRPYGVWLALAGSAGAGHPLGGILSTLLAESEAASGGLAAGLVHRRVAEALAARGQGPSAGLFVVLDDLQWIDESSLGLVHALLRRPGIPGLVFAAGLRPGEAGPHSPAARLLRDIERDGRLERVSLGPLTEEAAEALVRAVAGEGTGEAAGTGRETNLQDGAKAALLATASAGNPLFAIELARCAADLATGVPRSLQAAVGERLARVGSGARTLLAFAAAMGTGFDAELLARLSRLQPTELLPALDELEGGAILRACPDGRSYDFAHDIVRRVAYEQISPPRRRFLHSEVARSLAARPDSDGSAALTLARQAALGGLDRLAAEAFLAAAGRSLRLAATVEAEAHCERGLGHLAESDALETLGLRMALLRDLVHATQGLPRRRGLLEEVRRWVEVARGEGRMKELQVGLYLLGALTYAEGDLSAAERHVLDQAEALRGAEPRVAAAALANAGRCLAQIERDHSRAEALLREGREVAARAGLELVDIPFGLGMVAQAAGRDEEARRELGRALELARAAGDPWGESQCLARLAAIAIEQDENEVALASSDELARLAQRIGEPADAAIAHALTALARFQQAEPGAAAALDDAFERLRMADSKLHLAFVLNRAANRDLEEGRVELAAERAAEALDCSSRIGRRGQTAFAHLLLAKIAHRRGDVAAARREIAAAAEQNRPGGLLGGRTWTEIENWAARLAIPTPAPTASRQGTRASKGASP